MSLLLLPLQAIAADMSRIATLQQELDSILLSTAKSHLPAPSMLDVDTVVSHYLNTARQLSRQGETAASTLVSNHIIDFLTNGEVECDSLALAKAYFLNGTCYFDLGSADYALPRYYRALEIAKNSNDTPLMADIYNSIFSIYYQRRDFSNNVELLQMALDINIANGDSARIRSNYNNMGLVHYGLNDFDKALEYMQRAMQYTSHDDYMGQSLILTNIGEVYYKMGEPDKTEDMLAKALELQEKEKTFDKSSIHTLLNMALVKAILGKRTESLALQRRAIRALNETPASPAKADALLQLTETNFLLGDSIVGLRYLMQYELLNDSLMSDSHQAQLQQLLVAYDTERLKQNNELLKQSVRLRTFTIYGSILLVVLLIILAVVLLWRIKTFRRNSRLIIEQREQLQEYERQEHERMQQAMTQEIDHKNRQLTSYTIDLAASNEFNIKIKEQLDDAKHEIAIQNYEEANKIIGEVVHELMRSNDSRISNDFRVYFDEVHPDFLNVLSAKFPNLSKNDLRLCAYLHLGMSTKEIAALTYREIRSVDSSRNRLRKKLGIAPEVSLQQFLKTAYQGENRR